MEEKTMSGCSNPEAFERLVNSVKVKLYKTSMSILRSDDDACDAIQDTLLDAFKYFNTLKEEKYFNTWITRILINNCNDIIKKKQKISYINKECEISEDASYYDTYKSDSALESALNCLEFDLRKITVLFYYDNLSVQDISDILKIPEGTVKSRLSRAREKLFKILSEGGENDG